MHRIDSSGSVAGAWSNGTPPLTPGTAMDAAWFNAVQEELANVIETLAGTALVKGTNTQLGTALYALFGRLAAANTWGELNTFQLGVSATGDDDTPGVTAVGGNGDAAGVSATGTGLGAGVLATGGATNGNGVTAAGTGTGAGVNATGGATGHGGTFSGGATSGDGVRGTGTGAGGVGGRFTGSTSGAGDGVIALGGAGSSGRGVNAQGAAGQAGGIFTPGTSNTASARQSAVVLNAGDLTFQSNTNPDSDVAFTNSQAAANIVKGWAVLETTGGGGINVLDGFNVASAAIAVDVATITWASAFASANYAVSVNTDLSTVTPGVQTTTTTTSITLSKHSDGSTQDLDGAVIKFYVTAIGKQ